MVDERIRRAARLELARRDFWSFCKLMAPDFYREDRPYLKTLCRRLQAFCESDRKVLVSICRRDTARAARRCC